MPVLRDQQRVIEFVDLQGLDLELLSATGKQAASLIRRWLQGDDDFSISTSGSTGTPKVIPLKRNHIEYSARLTASTFGLKAGDKLLNCLNTESIAGFMMVMRAVINDCDLIITEPKANPLQDVSLNERIDFAAFVPLQMEAMLAAGFDTVKALNRMKAILVGGAPVSGTLQEKLAQIQAPLFQTYSMTETYTHIAIRRINGPFATDLYTPLEGVKLSQDERSCLVIQSPITDMQPLVTNDVVELLPDNSFRWLGRWDHIINSGGVKIQLEKVENLVSDIFHQEQIDSRFFAAGMPDERLGQRLVLIIEDIAWDESFLELLMQRLKKALGRYEVPKDILFANHFLETKSGKLDRISTLNQVIAGKSEN